LRGASREGKEWGGEKKGPRRRTVYPIEWKVRVVKGGEGRILTTAHKGDREIKRGGTGRVK